MNILDFILMCLMVISMLVFLFLGFYGLENFVIRI